MTPKQAKVYAAIRDLTVDGVAPTYRQICDHVGLTSVGGLYAMVDKLVDQGHLIRTPGGARSLTVVEGPRRVDLQKLPDGELLRIRAICGELLSSRASGRRAAA